MLVPLKWETGFDCRGDESMYIMTLDEKGLGLRENYRALEVLLLILWTNVFSARRCQEIAEVQFLQTVNHWTICWCHSCMETVRWRHKSRGRCQRLPGFGPRTQQHRYSRLPTVSLSPDSSFSLTPAVVSPVNRCQDMFQPHRRHLAIIWRETDMKLGWWIWFCSIFIFTPPRLTFLTCSSFYSFFLMFPRDKHNSALWSSAALSSPSLQKADCVRKEANPSFSQHHWHVRRSVWMQSLCSSFIYLPSVVSQRRSREQCRGEPNTVIKLEPFLTTPSTSRDLCLLV